MVILLLGFLYPFTFIPPLIVSKNKAYFMPNRVQTRDLPLTMLKHNHYAKSHLVILTNQEYLTILITYSYISLKINNKTITYN